MSDSIRDDQMKYVVEKMLDNAADVKRDREKSGNSQFYDGMMTAYHEMLDTMKNQLIIDDRDLKQFGLDIDLERALA